VPGTLFHHTDITDLAEALDFDAAWLGRRLAELGCQSTRERVISESGRVRQIRGYLVADLYASADATQDSDPLDGAL
jgi:S-DNA-T family DNA segregation ATPase FtsK/SpoIIIE